jgi:hypothetical protein
MGHSPGFQITVLAMLGRLILRPRVEHDGMTYAALLSRTRTYEGRQRCVTCFQGLRRKLWDRKWSSELLVPTLAQRVSRKLRLDPFVLRRSTF